MAVKRVFMSTEECPGVKRGTGQGPVPLFGLLHVPDPRGGPTVPDALRSKPQPPATSHASLKPLHPGCAISNLSGIMSATPMMQQYQSIRRTLPEGTFLLFRLGDFYELFFEDAKIA